MHSTISPGTLTFQT